MIHIIFLISGIAKTDKGKSWVIVKGKFRIAKLGNRLLM